jgi:hypothetical protein
MRHVCTLLVGALALPAVTHAATPPIIVRDPMQFTVFTPPEPLPPRDPAEMANLISFAAQTIVDRAGMLSKDQPVVVTTMVSMDDLSKSSTFGRLAEQLIADRITQRGYSVRDAAYVGALTVRPGTGEMVLSRDAVKIGAGVNAQAIVAGTYAVAGHAIYLSIRLIKPDDGVLLSTADVVIPLDSNTAPLVAAPIIEAQQ